MNLIVNVPGFRQEQVQRLADELKYQDSFEGKVHILMMSTYEFQIIDLDKLIAYSYNAKDGVRIVEVNR